MDQIQILVQVENRRKIVRVSTGDMKDLKAAVFAEFNGILLPEGKIIFQKWDDVFSVYVDLEEEGSPLKDKDKVQVLQELPINDRTSTPTAEVSDYSYVILSFFPFLRMQITRLEDKQCILLEGS